MTPSLHFAYKELITVRRSRSASNCSVLTPNTAGRLCFFKGKRKVDAWHSAWHKKYQWIEGKGEISGKKAALAWHHSRYEVKWTRQGANQSQAFG